jgi:hypothetical protein
MYYQSYKSNYYKVKKCGRNDSKFEAGYAFELSMRKKAGEIKDFVEQKTLELIVNGFVVCTYKIDFIVYHNDGFTEYVETKGLATETWKLKWKLFTALYGGLPDVKCSVVYQGKTWKPRMQRKKA